MIVTIIGSGPIGSAIAQELTSRQHIREIRICDSKSRPLKNLSKEISDPRIKSFQINAKDINAVREVAVGSSCIIGATDPSTNPMLAELSIEIGAHFCDNGGNDDVAKQILKLNDPAKEKGVWILPNCGLSPGLVETLCLHAVEQFDTAHRAHIRVGNLPLEPAEPFNFRLTTSANKVIEDYSNRAHLIVDGELQSVPALSHVEHIFFDNPFGLLEAFCTAGSIVLLAGVLCGRVQELDLKTITWPGHADQMKFVLDLGFGDNRSIDVRTHLTYRDILIRAMQKKLSGEHRDAVLVRVLVSGVREGAERTVVYEMIDFYDEENRMSAMRRSTGIPTSIIADMLISGHLEGGGASPPELAIDKDYFLKELAHRGLKVSTSWYEGDLSITDQSGYKPITVEA